MTKECKVLKHCHSKGLKQMSKLSFILTVMPTILIYDFRSATIKEEMPSNNDQYFHETKLKKKFLCHLFKYLGIPPQQVAVFK